jgi:hypothetical protein
MQAVPAYCIRMITAVRALPLAGIGCAGLLAVAGCGSSAFTITNASVDPSYTCPAGSDNAPYDVHATADVDNPTAQSVGVSSVSAVMVVADVHGAWQQKAGSEYDAGQVQYSPKTIGPSAKAKLQVTIPSACTNGPHQGVADDYGDYTVRLTVVTSAGTFRLTSQNKHRILAA